MDKQNIVERVREIAERAAEKNNLELVHVENVGSGKNQTIRVFIDSKEGITHDHCSAVSYEVEQKLDEEDFISEQYVLEVSSPGIERGLYKIEDFERFAGEAAKLKTHTAVGNQKNFRGIIRGVEEDEIIFDDRTNGLVNIPHSIIKKANLEFDLERELKLAKRK